MLDFGYDSVMGLSRTQINSKLSAQMYLEDTSTGRILWSEAFVGRALVKEYHGEKDAIVKMVGFAVDDLVGQVATSKGLLDQLELLPATEVDNSSD